MRPPSVLFVHDDFPAQFGGFAAWLAARGWEVGFATAAPAARADGIRILRYAPHRAPSPATHPYAQPMDRAALAAQAFVRAALAARRDGYRPDVVVAHSGPGAGMFARDVFPDAAYVPYLEWWYRFPGADVTFLGGAAPGVEAPMHERARNAPIAMDLAAADAAICPTTFQAAQFPAVFRDLIAVLHDGVDTAAFRPDPGVDPTLGGLVAADARVVSYATRGMEPHRGFPEFIAALPAILAADARAVAVIAGENRVAYGGDRQRGIDWKMRALAAADVDPARVRFVGTLGARDYRALLQRSDAHVYLTVPFVLSWSMLEAMSSGVALVASDTEPVREFADGECARLVEFRDPGQIEAALGDALAAGRADPRRAAARERVRARLDRRRLFVAKARFFASLR